MRKIDLTNFRVATSETARLINRRIALNLVRRHQPLSRADLARRSGLQRSTVSAIVEQLIDEGWVTEGAVGSAPRGRRPRVLHLNVERAGILGVDLRPGNDHGRSRRHRRALPDADDLCHAGGPDRVRTRARAHRLVDPDRASAGGLRGHRRQRARPSRPVRPAGVRAEPRLGAGRPAAGPRISARPPCRRRERRECVRAGGALVRAAPGPRARPRGGHRLRRHRCRHADQRAVGPRDQRDGRRVRPRHHRSRRAGVSLRTQGVLGTIRLQLRRGTVLRTGCRHRTVPRAARRPRPPSRGSPRSCSGTTMETRARATSSTAWGCTLEWDWRGSSSVSRPRSS